MIVECKNCGAPLAVVAHTRLTECAYCHKTNRVRSMRTVAMQQPPDWRPPSQWTPPEDAKARSVPLDYSAANEKATRRKFPLLTVLVVVLMTAGGLAGIAALWPQYDDDARTLARGLASSQSGSEPRPRPGPAPIWDGQEPFQCGDHAVRVLDGVDVALPHRTAVEISGHCQLTIRNAHIAAWEAITVQDHGRLLIEGSTIEASEAVIAATGHADVEVIDSTLTSAGIAITASGHSQVVLAGGNVTGAPRAIGRRGRRHVEVRDCEIHDAPRHRAPTKRHQMARHNMDHPIRPAAAEDTPCGRRCATSLSNCLESATDEVDRHGCTKFDDTCRRSCSR